MEITARVTIGPNIYAHHVEKKVVIEVSDTDVTNAQQLKEHLKIAEKNLRDLVRNFDCHEAAEKIRVKQDHERIKKELKDEMELEDKAKYELKSEIVELKKELKKRDCRLDGIIASHNEKYIPPNENGEPQELS